jgi:hypothetical protein
VNFGREEEINNMAACIACHCIHDASGETYETVGTAVSTAELGCSRLVYDHDTNFPKPSVMVFRHMIAFGYL